MLGRSQSCLNGPLSHSFELFKLIYSVVIGELEWFIVLYIFHLSGCSGNWSGWLSNDCRTSVLWLRLWVRNFCKYIHIQMLIVYEKYTESWLVCWTNGVFQSYRKLKSQHWTPKKVLEAHKADSYFQILENCHWAFRKINSRSALPILKTTTCVHNNHAWLTATTLFCKKVREYFLCDLNMFSALSKFPFF